MSNKDVVINQPADVDLFGQFADITGSLNLGSIEIALCGYGSRTPKVLGGAGAQVLSLITVIPAPDPGWEGDFHTGLYSNGIITPEGTYYTVVVKDDNGDIIQCEAYTFAPGQYDLASLTPFDPNFPPQPLPVSVGNELLIVQGANDAHFDGAQYTTFQCLMTQDITGAYLTNMIPGNLYTFIIRQDSVGGHYFNWPNGPAPAYLYNPTAVDERPNATTIQTFVVDDQGALYAIAPGTVYV